MDKKLSKAISALLNQIEEEAQSSFRECQDGVWVWNVDIWQLHDPTLYKKWRAVYDLMRAEAKRIADKKFMKAKP